MNPPSDDAQSKRSKDTWVVLALLLGLAIVLYFVLFSGSPAAEDKLAVELLQERQYEGKLKSAQETTPPVSNPSSPPAVEEATDPVTKDRSGTDENRAEEQEESIPVESPAPDQVDLEYLVVHSFAVKSNAKNFASKLTEHGYEVKSAERDNGWTAVGVLFDPKTVALEGLMDAIKAEYDAEPILWDELDSSN